MGFATTGSGGGWARCQVEALVAAGRTQPHPRPLTMIGREGLWRRRRRRSVCREAPPLPLFIGVQGSGWLLIQEMAAPFLQYDLSAPSMALRVKADPLVQPSALGFRPWHSSPRPPHPPPTTPKACGTRGRFMQKGGEWDGSFRPVIEGQGESAGHDRSSSATLPTTRRETGN